MKPVYHVVFIIITLVLVFFSFVGVCYVGYSNFLKHETLVPSITVYTTTEKNIVGLYYSICIPHFYIFKPQILVIINSNTYYCSTGLLVVKPPINITYEIYNSYYEEILITTTQLA
jgi:hypothetical protein